MSPVEMPPFHELVVGKCSGGNGENRLSTHSPAFHEKLEYESLSSAGRRIDDHVPTPLKVADRLLLPKIGDRQREIERLTFESRGCDGVPGHGSHGIKRFQVECTPALRVISDTTR